MDNTLSKVTEQVLLELIYRQFDARAKAVKEIAEIDAGLRDSLGEFMRRCDTGAIGPKGCNRDTTNR